MRACPSRNKRNDNIMQSYALEGLTSKPKNFKVKVDYAENIEGRGGNVVECRTEV
jgi:hypothetical protein